MKVIIPVAGLGTRMLPATKAIPKEMLTIVDKPLIQYIVNECVAAGFKEIVLVTHSSKNAIENHFDTTFELETMLANRDKKKLLKEVQSLIPKDVRFIHIRQGQAKGLGHAVLCARTVVGDNAFAVVLPDVLLPDFESDHSKENLAAMVERFYKTGASQIMVSPVERELVKNYGVVDCHGMLPAVGESARIYRTVEKPDPNDAPSNLAVVGRYVFTKEIWQLLETTPVGTGGEIQLTDAIDALLEKPNERVEAYQMSGNYFDCGDKLGYAKAFVAYGLQNRELNQAFKSYIDQLANK